MPNFAVKYLVTSRAIVKIVVKELQRMTVARVIPYNGLGMLGFCTTDGEGAPNCGTLVAMIWKPRYCFCSDNGGVQRSSWGFMNHLRPFGNHPSMNGWPHKPGRKSNVAWT